MVPNRVGWKPLRFLFAKDFGVTSVTLGYLCVVGILFRWEQRDSAYEISVVFDRSGSIYTSGDKLGFFCIGASKYNGKVSVVNPASFPVYLGLHCCEPWVTEDGFVFTKVGEEELERDGGRPGSYIQDGVIAEVSALVFRAIDVEEFAGFWELFDGESKPFGVGEVHEVFGSS